MSVRCGNYRPRSPVITLWLSLLFLLMPFSAWGQNYYFEQYGSKAGLSASKIYTIIQDANDFIWLGTGSGVTAPLTDCACENFSTSDRPGPGGGKTCMAVGTRGEVMFSVILAGCGHGLCIEDQ